MMRSRTFGGSSYLSGSQENNAVTEDSPTFKLDKVTPSDISERSEIHGNFSVTVTEKAFSFSERKSRNGDKFITEKEMSKVYEHDRVVWIVCIGILFVTGNVFFVRASYMEMKTLRRNEDTIVSDMTSRNSSEDGINVSFYE
jgi:hypothetical protein